MTGTPMTREILTYRQQKVAVGVADSRVVSVRSGDETETVVRMYADGRVGLASAVGPHDADALERTARAALAHGVPYAPGPAAPATVAVDRPGTVYEPATLVRETEAALDALRAEYPDFVFSNKVTATRTELTLRNDRGLDLSWSTALCTAAILVKQKGSLGIVDCILVVDGTTFDGAALLAQAAMFLPPFREPVGEAPTGRVRTVFEGLGALAGRLSADLTERSLRTGASVFSGRDVQVNPAFRLVDTRDPTRQRVCPFDLEGTVRATPELDLLGAGGVRGVADRRDALTYGVEPTGNARGQVHELPRSYVGEIVVPGTGDVKALSPDGAILVALAMGADCSDAGDYALPVQLAYRLDADGRPTERLPQLTLRGNLFDVFGDDYVGATASLARPGVEENHLVTHLHVA